MAEVKAVHRCWRPVRTSGKCIMDVNCDKHLFSMWVRVSGAETGLDEHPLNIQLDRCMAERLRVFLNDFLSDEE